MYITCKIKVTVYHIYATFSNMEALNVFTWTALDGRLTAVQTRRK